MICPRCENENYTATRYCAECGWDLGSDAAGGQDTDAGDEAAPPAETGGLHPTAAGAGTKPAGNGGAPHGETEPDPVPESTPVTWAFHAGSRVNAPPLITADTVFFGGSDRRVYALDATSGSVRWTYAVDGRPESGLSLSEGTVFTGSSDNSLYAIDAVTGEERWYFTTRGSITARPVVAGGVVLFGSHDGDFYGVDAATGEERWRVVTGSKIAEACAIAGELAYFTNRVGVLVAVRVADGSVVHDLNHLDNATAPVAAGGMILTGSGRGVQAIDAATGRDAWYAEALVTVRRPPAAGEGIACFEAGDYLYALESESGEQLWQHLLPQPVTYPAAVAGGSVYYVDDSRYLTLLSLANGLEQKSWYTGCRSGCGTPVVADGRAAMGCDDNLLSIDLGLLPEADAGGRGPWNREEGDGDGADGTVRPVKAYSNAQESWHLYPLFLFGGSIYLYYWFFRNWKYMKVTDIRDVSPGWRLTGLLSPLIFGFAFGFFLAAGGADSSRAQELLLAGVLGFTILTLYLMYDLFRDVRDQAKAESVRSYSLGFVTAGFFTLQNLPVFITQLLTGFDIEISRGGVLGLVLLGLAGTAASIFIITFVQKTINRLWERRNPGIPVRKRFTGREKVLMIVVGLLQALYLLNIAAGF